jgi:hypothetical protein
MARSVRIRMLTAATALGLAAAGLQAPAALGKDKAPPAHEVTFTAWDFGDAGSQGGTHEGTGQADDSLTLTDPVGTMEYDDPHDADAATTTYEYGTWTSPEVDPGDFGLTELVASWNADAPVGSWIQVEVSGDTNTGTTSKWYVLGRWAEHDTGFHPTSLSGQGDEDATVLIDTLATRAGITFVDYRIRVTLYREAGTQVTPSVGFVGAMASYVNAPKKHEVSATTMESTVELDVPTYSQETHIGHFPQYDNGGEAWCSPTSTTMVLRYWDDTAPAPAGSELYDWVYAEVPDEQDPWVDYAARYTYDYNYDGAGNWPFNTAYAARFGNEAFVTRLRSLAEAEPFIKAGIPLVVSMSFKESELDGAGYGTNGHLLTIAGLEADGDVIVNDPASHLIPDNDEVRVVYDRAEFEEAWIGTTGGLSYVIHPEDAPLPAGAHTNW